MIGQRISHYKILEELGGGGMGVVYKAEDIKLERPVALKFLPPELTSDPDAKKRFVHEAKAASALQHHNICTIHEIDETDDGRMFISMDCYEGETLKEKIAPGPLELEEALNIAIQIAEGLAKAHKAGMVHRDIKPANIMITNDGVVKIVDFGLAKLVGQTKVTKTGTTVGTVAYMSPEQARGEEVDARSDVFSLGAVIYEMLTGHIPFKGDHEAAVMYGIMHNDPNKLAMHRSDLPEQIQQIIDKALAKDTSKRHESALELLKDLAPWRPVRPAVSGGSRIFPSKIKLKHIIAVSVLVALVGAIAFIVGKQRQGGPSVDDFSLAIVDFRDLVDPDDPLASMEITALLHVGLVESSPIRVVSPDYLHDLRRRLFGSVRGIIEEGEALEVARKSGSTLLLSGQIKVGEYAMWRLVETKSGKSVAARRADGKIVTAIADKIIDEVLPLIARECGVEETSSAPSVAALTSDSPQAFKHYIAGLLAREELRQRDAVREFERSLSYDSTFALAYLELSRAHMGTIGYKEPELARAHFDKAWDLRTRLGIKDRMRLDVQRAIVEAVAGDVLMHLRDMQRLWPEDRVVLTELCEMLFWWGYLTELLSVAEQGLEFYPDEVIIGKYYAVALAGTGRLKDALEVSHNHVRRHPENPDAWDDLGLRWLNLGQPDSAEAAFRQSGIIDPSFRRELRLADCAYARGDVDQAIDLTERVIKRVDLSPSERAWTLTQNAYSLGLAFIYSETGRNRHALRIMEETLGDISDPMAEAALEWNCIPLLLRIGQAEDISRWARSSQGLSEVPDKVKHSSLRYRVSLRFRAFTLVSVDSLDAARSLVGALRDAERLGGVFPLYFANAVATRIALAEGKPEAALEYLHEMKQIGLFHGGLVDIEYREDLARAHQMAGRMDEAVNVHEELLRVYGGHALSHYELGKIYNEMGRTTEAKREFTRFIEMWSNADEGLPQVEDAKNHLTSLGKSNP